MRTQRHKRTGQAKSKIKLDKTVQKFGVGWRVNQSRKWELENTQTTMAGESLFFNAQKDGLENQFLSYPQVVLKII